MVYTCDPRLTYSIINDSPDQTTYSIINDSPDQTTYTIINHCQMTIIKTLNLVRQQLQIQFLLLKHTQKTCSVSMMLCHCDLTAWPRSLKVGRMGKKTKHVTSSCRVLHRYIYHINSVQENCNAYAVDMASQL